VIVNVGVTGNMFSGGCEIKGSRGDNEPSVVVVVVKMERRNRR
jgi:hypothetical protein